MPRESAVWRDVASIARDWARWSPAEKLVAVTAGLATASAIALGFAI